MAEELIETTYHVIRPGQPRETATVQWPAEPKLGLMHDLLCPLLGFNWPERVRVLDEGKYTDMFVDELGVQKRLEFNEEATRIYRANWLSQYKDANPDDLPPILGTAILFARPVWF